MYVSQNNILSYKQEAFDEQYKGHQISGTTNLNHEWQIKNSKYTVI